MKLEEAIEILEYRFQIHGLEDYLAVVAETNRIFQDLNSKCRIKRLRISTKLEADIVKGLSDLMLMLMHKEYGSERDIFSREFVDYTKGHYENGQRYRLSSENVLLNALKKSRLGFVGDLHYVKETKRSLIRLLQVLIQDKSVTLGLESIKVNQQGVLEAYQHSDLTYDEFLDELVNTGSERIMIDFNKELYDFARRNRSRVRLVALDTNGSLEQRDNGMSLTISDNVDQDIFVVFAGSGHVAKDHLPKKTSEKSGVDGVIIYQNLPSLYYRLLLRSIRPEGVVARLSQKEFCIFNINPLEEVVSIQDYRNSLLEESDVLFQSYKQNAAKLYQTVLKMVLMNRDDYFKLMPHSEDKPKVYRRCQEATL